jgi:nicotinamide phosphoribosyltransferase
MKIRAVPEGTVLPYKNVLFTCENTDPEAFWLCTWFETLLVQCWYPLTVASLSRAQKVTIKTYMAATADDEAMGGLGFKLHDFGFRGATCAEAAAIGGAAHLVNFMGSDTVAALQCAREVYGLPADQVSNSLPHPSVPYTAAASATAIRIGFLLGWER